jgi:HAD superfamily hydrolase (TIGR01549 family)
MRQDGADIASTVVFDCFATLLRCLQPRPRREAVTETVASLLPLDRTTARRIVYPLYCEAFWPGLAQPNVDARIADLCHRHGVPELREPLYEALWQAWGAVEAYQPFAGSKPTLVELRARGYRVGLLSNCLLPPSLMERLLREFGLWDLFDQTYFSSEGRGKKPQHQVFEQFRTADREGYTMVGDSDDDILPAQELGWRTVRVRAEGPRLDEILASA